MHSDTQHPPHGSTPRAARLPSTKKTSVPSYLPYAEEKGAAERPATEENDRNTLNQKDGSCPPKTEEKNEEESGN